MPWLIRQAFVNNDWMGSAGGGAGGRYDVWRSFRIRTSCPGRFETTELVLVRLEMQAEVLEDMKASEDPLRPATSVPRLISEHRFSSKLIDGFIDVRPPT